MHLPSLRKAYWSGKGPANAMNANVDSLKPVALIYQRDATNFDVNKKQM